MRFKKPRGTAASGDLTPMIDMTFQLIAFFMVLVNFTEADQNERVKLPSSELAKPPDAPLESPLFLHLTKEGIVYMGGRPEPLSNVKNLLIAEANVLKLKKSSPANATVIIRGDAQAPAGQVEKLIQICQEAEFENFALCAEEKIE